MVIWTYLNWNAIGSQFKDPQKIPKEIFHTRQTIKTSLTQIVGSEVRTSLLWNIFVTAKQASGVRCQIFQVLPELGL